MAERTPFSVKVDDQVQGQFREYVQESKGKLRGELGRELENAMVEYMDNDRGARLESKVDENAEMLETLLSMADGSHTHTPNESLAKAEQIAAELDAVEKTVIQTDRVRRAIESVAGADDRTIEKYRRQLKRQGLAYEHPGTSAVWTLDRTTWLGWADSYVDNNPTQGIGDVIGEYPLTHDEYIDTLETEGMYA